MKVLHVINHLGSGGAESLLRDALPIMKKTIEVEVLLLTDKGNVFADELVDLDVKVDVIPFKKLMSFKNVFFIRKYVKKGNYDVVHVHLFPAQYWVVLAMLFLRKAPKLIFTEHSTHNRRREKALFKLIEKPLYHRYDAIVSISQKTQENLLLWITPAKDQFEKYCVVENGVNLEKFQTATPYQKNALVEGIKEEDKLICMIARFVKEKDQSTLIKAMNVLGEHIHVLLIGEGPLLEEMRALTQKLRLEKRVHFFGFRQDIPSILKTVDLVVLSSHWEGFGLAAVEAMAANKPIIGTDVDGLKGIIVDHELLFEAGNVSELSKKIEYLLMNEDIYHQKLSYVKERAKQFSIREMVEKYLLIYDSSFLDEKTNFR